MVVFGDTSSCALLKEIAISMSSTNLDSSMSQEGWSEVKEYFHLVTELFELMCYYRGFKNSTQTPISATSLCTMNTSDLRENFQPLKLQADGSHDILSERLEACHNLCILFNNFNLIFA